MYPWNPATDLGVVDGIFVSILSGLPGFFGMEVLFTVESSTFNGSLTFIISSAEAALCVYRSSLYRILSRIVAFAGGRMKLPVSDANNKYEKDPDFPG